MQKITITLAHLLIVGTLLVPTTALAQSAALPPEQQKIERLCYDILNEEAKKEWGETYTKDAPHDIKAFLDQALWPPRGATNDDPLLWMNLQAGLIQRPAMSFGEEWPLNFSEINPYAMALVNGRQDDFKQQAFTATVNYFSNGTPLYCRVSNTRLIHPDKKLSTLRAEDIGFPQFIKPFTIETIERDGVKFKKVVHEYETMTREKSQKPLMAKRTVFIIPDSHNTRYNPYLLIDAMKAATDAYYQEYAPAAKALLTQPDKIYTVYEDEKMIVQKAKEKLPHWDEQPTFVNGEITIFDPLHIADTYIFKKMVETGQEVATRIWSSNGMAVSENDQDLITALKIRRGDYKADDQALDRPRIWILRDNTPHLVRKATKLEERMGTKKPETSDTVQMFTKLADAKRAYDQAGVLDESYLNEAAKYIKRYPKEGHQQIIAAPDVQEAKVINFSEPLNEDMGTEMTNEPSKLSRQVIGALFILSVFSLAGFAGWRLLLRRK